MRSTERYRPGHHLRAGAAHLSTGTGALVLGTGKPPAIADLGCGTGISTRLFASTGHPVIGIDPNAEVAVMESPPQRR